MGEKPVFVVVVVVAAAAAVVVAAAAAVLADVAAVKSHHYLNCHSDFPWFRLSFFLSMAHFVYYSLASFQTLSLQYNHWDNTRKHN